MPASALLKLNILALAFAGALALGVPIMPAAAEQNEPVILLQCELSYSDPALAGRFGDEFCRALARNLSEDLGARFLLEGTDEALNHEGKSILVQLDFVSESKANAETTVGHFEGGAFVRGDTQVISLQSLDRPLDSESAQTLLVRPIGLQLGLIR